MYLSAEEQKKLDTLAKDCDCSFYQEALGYQQGGFCPNPPKGLPASFEEAEKHIKEWIEKTKKNSSLRSFALRCAFISLDTERRMWTPALQEFFSEGWPLYLKIQACVDAKRDFTKDQWIQNKCADLENAIEDGGSWCLSVLAWSVVSVPRNAAKNAWLHLFKDWCDELSSNFSETNYDLLPLVIKAMRCIVLAQIWPTVSAA